MTVTTQAGAASHDTLNWHAIDWQKVHTNVRRLQVRIVKATQEGKWGKVKSLQRLLTRSFSAKALAVKRVTENTGKNTPGVDGVTWSTPEEKAEAVESLNQRGYKPQPLRRIYIPKDATGQTVRPLGIPIMKDRAMQALYLLSVDPVAETCADKNSYGFRKERNCADAIEQCFAVLSRKNSAEWVLEGDIRACFDTIDHNWLLEHIPMERQILSRWLETGYMEKGQWFSTTEGTPQGGIISPVLANLTLDGIERLFQEHFPKRTRQGEFKVNLVRYADDFIITGRSRELLEEEVKPLISAFLRERGLELSEKKTHITHIDDGFDFLGQNLRKYKGKLLIKPSKKNLKTFLDKVRYLIRTNKHTKPAQLIYMLNHQIRGWTMYHRHVVSRKVFERVDREIFIALWRWAKYRHPNKGRKWIKQRYFKRVGSWGWVFYGEHYGQEYRLMRARSVKIQRHTKIRYDANPYDPDWEIYFEKRLGLKMANNLRGRRQLLYLWREQEGICPVCRQKITTITGWHNHHIQWRSHGGSDHAENRILLHPNCHRQVHSQKLTVEKPRPTLDV